MTLRTWIVALIVFAGPGVLAAQPTRDIVNNNTLNHGSTIRDLLQTLDKVAGEHPGVSDELKRLRGTFGIVFVPGILGSTLESKSKGNLWGSGIPKPDDLRLDPQLVNERERSDVTTGLALSLAGVSLYDVAFQKIHASAAKLGIPAERIAACGYDWRRDIRWGADELNECIAAHPNLRDVTALIVIAHSMGGVVTWQWHATHAANGRTHDKRVVAVAILGAPLEGSCEMLRMMQAGYVQPVENTKLRDDQVWKRWWSTIAAMKDRFVNVVTRAFSQDLRPVILTWPGAFELMPRAALSLNDDQHLCARTPLDPADAGNLTALTPFAPEFWSRAFGADVLSPFMAPSNLGAVLEKAAEFRGGFSVTTLTSPTYLFASFVWVTPVLAPLTGDFRLAAGDWFAKDGDGRVPLTSARPESVKAAETFLVYSVHGNLPEDEMFHEQFFTQRLPRVRDAYVAAEILRQFGANDGFQGLYARKGGTLVNPHDFRTGFERLASPDIIYPLTLEAWNSAVNFNRSLCDGAIACTDEYRSVAAAARGKSDAVQAAAFTSVIMGAPKGSREETFALAQRGLAMARSLNWPAAIADLSVAVPRLDQLRTDAAGVEAQNVHDLRVNATAMLGRSLAIRGYCAEAKAPLRKAALEKQAFAVRDVESPCYDRTSGRYVPLNR
jgi:pimeloyl-ACP methyl ester carboxylesterase